MRNMNLGGDTDLNMNNLLRERDEAIAKGDVAAAAAAAAALKGIRPFNPHAYGLLLSSEFEMRTWQHCLHRGNFSNPDLLGIADRVAMLHDTTRQTLLPGDIERDVMPEYARLAANRVGTYEVWEGNGNTRWDNGGPRLTVYPPNGDTIMGRLSEEALGALEAAGYSRLEDLYQVA